MLNTRLRPIPDQTLKILFPLTDAFSWLSMPFLGPFDSFSMKYSAIHSTASFIPSSSCSRTIVVTRQGREVSSFRWYRGRWNSNTRAKAWVEQNECANEFRQWGTIDYESKTGKAFLQNVAPRKQHFWERTFGGEVLCMFIRLCSHIPGSHLTGGGGGTDGSRSYFGSQTSYPPPSIPFFWKAKYHFIATRSNLKTERTRDKRKTRRDWEGKLLTLT